MVAVRRLTAAADFRQVGAFLIEGLQEGKLFRIFRCVYYGHSVLGITHDVEVDEEAHLRKRYQGMRYKETAAFKAGLLTAEGDEKHRVSLGMLRVVSS